MICPDPKGALAREADAARRIDVGSGGEGWGGKLLSAHLVQRPTPSITRRGAALVEQARSYADLNRDRWIQSPEC